MAIIFSTPIFDGDIQRTFKTYFWKKSIGNHTPNISIVAFSFLFEMLKRVRSAAAIVWPWHFYVLPPAGPVPNCSRNYYTKHTLYIYIYIRYRELYVNVLHTLRKREGEQINTVVNPELISGWHVASFNGGRGGSIAPENVSFLSLKN